MPLYRVVQKPNAQSPLETIYLAERFSWFAFVLPPVWALVHWMWLEALVWLVVTVGLGAASWLIGDAAANWLYVLFALWIGFAATSLRVANLRRRGYGDAGFVGAVDEIAAEQDVIARNRA